FFFFFSSRRRHTRSKRDWSSDVCSSDLVPDSLLGKTLAWSCAAQRYRVTGDSGAPATAVRFVLYQRAPDGAIACAPTAVGRLDQIGRASCRERVESAVGGGGWKGTSMWG